MVRLLTFTTILLASLVAFTTADVWRLFVLTLNLDANKGYDKFHDHINKISNYLTQASFMAQGFKQDDGLNDIYKNFHVTFESGGFSDVACQSLSDAAGELKKLGKAKETADAINEVIQHHGNLLYATTKFNDPRFPAVMMPAVKLLLAAYHSYAS
ncbi:unnamed protein product [Tilletia controversa]|nr:unnamed protein product [Tilletia controversa]